jgi:hypothetical protein
MKQPKKHPLKIEWLYCGDDYGPSIFFSRGHHDHAEFLREVCLDQSVELPPTHPVEHDWWRATPTRNDGIWTTTYIPTKPKTRGAFSVTSCDAESFRELG